MIKKIEENIDNFYLIAVFLYVFSKLIKATAICEFFSNNYLYNLFVNSLRYLSYVLLLLKLFFDKYDKKSLLKIAFIMCLCFASGFNSSFYVIFLMLFIIGARNVDFNKVIKLDFILKISFIFAVILLCVLKIIPNYVYISGDRIRNSLGFDYCSTLPALLLIATCEFLYLYNKKINLIFSFLIIFLNAVVLLLTNTRFPFLYCMLLFLLYFLISYNKKIYDILLNNNKFLFAIPIITSIVSLILQFFYDGNNVIYKKLNLLITGRLALGHRAIINYGINLFGHKLKLIGNSFIPSSETYNYVDSSFLQILIVYGIIFFVVIICLTSYTFFKYKNDLFFIIVFSIICLYSMFDPFLIEPKVNIFVFSLGCFFSSIEKKENQFHLWEFLKKEGNT